MPYLMLLFASVTQTFNLPPGLLSALCFVESHHKISAYHPDDGGSASLGVCQIKLETAQLLGFQGTAKELRHNAKVNVYYAGKYLKRQLIRYENNKYKALAAYNAGSYREGKVKGLAKNRRYVAKVMAAWRASK